MSFQNRKSNLVLLVLLIIAFSTLPFSVFAESDIHAGSHLSQDRFMQKATKPWKLGVVSSGGFEGNQYWPIFNEAMRKAGEEFGVQIKFRFFTTSKKGKGKGLQIKGPVDLIQEFITEGVDGLIVFPSGNPTKKIEQVYDMGIPVITINARVPSEKVLTQLTFDNYEAGLQLGSWVAKHLKKDAKAAILAALPHRPNYFGAKRTQGLLDGLKKAKSTQILDIQDGGWDRTNAKKITHRWLSQYDKIDAILANNDAMALGAVEAIEEAGVKLPIIVGIDAVPEAREAVRQKRLTATLDQAPAKQGRTAVQLLIRHLEKGESYPKISTWRDTPIITADDFK